MSPETQSAITNLIAGAAIGFLFSTISTFIAHRFQMQREETNRKWEKENKQNEIRREILKKRASEAETVIELMYDVTLRIAQVEFDILVDNKTFLEKFTSGFEEEMKIINKKYSSILNVGDDKLTKYAHELQNINIEEGRQAPNLIDTRRKKSFDKKRETERVQVFLEKASNVKTDFVKRLDELVSLT